MKHSELRNRVIQGIYWSFAAKLTIQLVSWGITFFVIRLLDPDDYGLAAMSDVVFCFLFMLTAEGMFSALVQAREIDERKLRQMFGVLLVLNGALFLAQYSIAPLIAMYYGEPRVVQLLQLHALAFLFVPFGAIPNALLDRALNVRARAVVEMGTQLGSSIVVLVLALLDYGVWALIIGMVCRFAFRAIGLNIAAPWFKLPIFSLRGIEGLFGFGGYMTVTHVLWFVYAQADVFIGGRMLSARELGIYSVASHLASLPMSKVVQMLNEVAFPAYARLQDRLDKVREHLCKSVRLVALVTLPLFIGLASVAPELIPVVFGPAWEPAIVPLQIFCLVMPFQSVTALVEAPLGALGHAKTRLGNNLIAVLIMPLAFIVGVRWGVIGLSMAWLIAYPVVWYLMLRRSLRVLEVGQADLLRGVISPLFASLVMLIAIAFARPYFTGLPRWETVLLLVVLGGVVYSSVLLLCFPARVKEAVDLVRKR